MKMGWLLFYQPADLYLLVKAAPLKTGLFLKG
jgi:hypothetical protein